MVDAKARLTSKEVGVLLKRGRVASTVERRVIMPGVAPRNAVEVAARTEEEGGTPAQGHVLSDVISRSLEAAVQTRALPAAVVVMTGVRGLREIMVAMRDIEGDQYQGAEADE
jgi:hypothetical protein